MLSFRFLDRFRDHGLLLMRVGLGVMFMGHGAPKLMGGPEAWAKIGAAMGSIGIDFVPEFWGLMAGLSEFLGGLLLAIGLLTRPALAFLGFTMFVAAAMHLNAGHSFTQYSRPIEMLIVFIALIFVGPGRFSCDEKFMK